MKNNISSVVHARKAAALDEAARLKAAYYAATTNWERAALLREAKIRLVQRQLLEDFEDAETDAA